MTILRAATDDDVAALLVIHNRCVATSHANYDVRAAALNQGWTWFALYPPADPHHLLCAKDGREVLQYARVGTAVTALPSTRVEVGMSHLPKEAAPSQHSKPGNCPPSTTAR